MPRDKNGYIKNMVVSKQVGGVCIASEYASTRSLKVGQAPYSAHGFLAS